MSTENFTEASTDLAEPVSVPVPSHQRTNLATIQEDILSQIFYLLSRDPEETRIGTVLWDWITITEVCRYWHAVATGTPSLWAYLDKFHRTNRFQTFLRRSQDADLVVIYDDSQRIGRGEFTNLKVVMKEMGRIRSLLISAELPQAQAAELLPFFELPSPRMVALWILTSVFNPLPRFRLPPTKPGVLRNVSLKNMKLPSLMISGLTRLSHLVLEKCDFKLEEMLGVVRASPGLKLLRVVSCIIDVPSSEAESSTEMEAIVLPDLDILDVQLSKLSVGYKIFQVVHAPNVRLWLAKFTAKLSQKNLWKLDVLRKVMQDNYRVDLMSIEIAHVSELPDRSAFRMLMGDPDQSTPNGGQLSLHFDPQMDMNIAIHRWVEVFHPYLAGIRLLDVDAKDDSVSVQTWDNVFRACGSARTVKVHLGYKGQLGESLFEALGRTEELQSGVTAVDVESESESEFAFSGPFPDMNKLVVYWNGHWESGNDPDPFVRALEDFLEKREAAGVVIQKVIVDSNESDKMCTMDSELDESGALQAWADGIRKMRKKKDEFMSSLFKR